jgi:hypothetical protein
MKDTHRTSSSLLLLLLLALPLGSCGSSIAQRAATRARVEALVPHLSDRLYLGRAISGGGTVSEEQWSEFLRDVITPRFPEGLTYWRAKGQWRDGLGTILSEETFVLELIHREDEGADRAIEEIIDAYKTRFRQQSVLRVRSTVVIGSLLRAIRAPFRSVAVTPMPRSVPSC